MNRDKKYVGVIIGIADCYVKTTIALEEAFASFCNFEEEAYKVAIRVSEILLSCGINGESLSPMTIQNFFDELNKCDVGYAGISPKEYAASLHKSHKQPCIHYNYIPRAHRNLPYQRRSY